MTPEQELQILRNAVLFMNRVTLSGNEVVAYNEVMQYLHGRTEAITPKKGD